MNSPPFGDGPVGATVPRVPCTFGAAETRGYSEFSPSGELNSRRFVGELNERRSVGELNSRRSVGGLNRRARLWG